VARWGGRNKTLGEKLKEGSGKGLPIPVSKTRHRERRKKKPLGVGMQRLTPKRLAVNAQLNARGKREIENRCHRKKKKKN